MSQVIIPNQAKINSYPVLLIGANRGLGLAVAKTLTEKDIEIIVSGRNPDSLKDSIKQKQLNPLKKIILDFESDDLANTSATIMSLPALSGIVHFASMYSNNFIECSLSDIKNWSVFYGHTLAMAKASLSKLKESGGGRIILIGSIVGSPGRLTASHYSIYKGWLKLLAEAISREGYKFNVSATYLNLGSFRDDEIADKSPNQYVKTSDVVTEVIRLLCLSPTLRIENADLLPISEMMK